ncbi:MAG: aldolase [Betaproteobacteria bacterium]|nr:MAG: aldolase [Betaproteobacteria bacterium]
MMDPTLIVNPVKRRLDADERVLMMSLRQLRTPDAAMIVRECGFDGFYVDCEHGTYSRAEVSALCASGLLAGLMPAVRAPGADEASIGAALDGGALAVIVPHVGDAGAAQAAVRAAKYPPSGHRSLAALGPATRYRSLPLAEIARLQNDATLVIAMLETAQGIENAEAIAAVPGIDALMIGPADLSGDLGLTGELKHPRIEQAWFSAAAAARKHGKHFVAGAGGPDIAEMVARGARILMGTNDVAYLMSAAREAATKMRTTRRRS